MENANPPPTSNRPILSATLRAQAVQELYELQRILDFVDSPLENNDSDDSELLNELIEYKNVEMLCREKEINSFDGNDLAFQSDFMLGVVVFDYRLYLTRRSLEVLRKFHWMILGGRFNQSSHVSFPLLSIPGEY
ncbi:hypothetical protein Tco_0973890 [Tanacetum coccineum]|uniref:Uncharacterized protein n=1 Tax=Tanacetum coccineum TaxID=301880 RepID=A0ABQ5EA03_9ASTR